MDTVASRSVVVVVVVVVHVEAILVAEKIEDIEETVVVVACFWLRKRIYVYSYFTSSENSDIIFLLIH